jgi:hypothetical protein
LVASALPKEKNSKATKCAMYKQGYEMSKKAAEEAREEGNQAVAEIWDENTSEEYLKARELGCEWATKGFGPHEAPPTPRTTQEHVTTPPPLALD